MASLILGKIDPGITGGSKTAMGTVGVTSFWQIAMIKNVVVIKTIYGKGAQKNTILAITLNIKNDKTKKEKSTMKKLLLTLTCSCLMFGASVFCNTAEVTQAIAPVAASIAIAPATSAPIATTPKKEKTDASKALTAQLKEIAKTGDIAKLQTVLADTKNEQQLLKNCTRCKDVTKTIIYKTICNAVKSNKLEIVKELLAKETILNAFNAKVSATKFDAVKADRLEKLIAKNNRLDFAEFLIEKTEYRVRLAGLVAINDAKLKVTQDMKNLLAKHSPNIPTQAATAQA